MFFLSALYLSGRHQVSHSKHPFSAAVGQLSAFAYAFVLRLHLLSLLHLRLLSRLHLRLRLLLLSRLRLRLRLLLLSRLRLHPGLLLAQIMAFSALYASTVFII